MVELDALRALLDDVLGAGICMLCRHKVAPLALHHGDCPVPRAAEAIASLRSKFDATAKLVKYVRVLQSHAEGAKRGERHNVDGAYLGLKQVLVEYDATRTPTESGKPSE